MTTVLIAGAGRSGTSMVSRLLNLVGLSLGPENRMMPATSGNEHGYWEHLDFVAINDEALRCVDAGWDFEPCGSWDSPTLPLGRVRESAAEAVARFGDTPLWGFKDPRTSFTLPFWLPLLRDPKIVVCLRHPLDVARSLSDRHYLSEASGLDLWWRWNTRLLTDAEATPLVVTHYDSYFRDPVHELRRVANALAISVSDDALHRAVTSIDPDSRHHVTEPNAHLSHPRWDEVRRVYGDLCVRAGRPDLAPRAQT